MKSATDFIPDHVGSRDVLVLGMNPSTKTKPFKNATFARLQSWMNHVGIPHWDFHNVVPDKTGDVKVSDVDQEALRKKCEGRRVIVCLGGFVKRVASTLDLGPETKLVFVDHPSPRNRNFNDPSYEPEMLRRFKRDLKVD